MGQRNLMAGLAAQANGVALNIARTKQRVLIRTLAARCHASYGRVIYECERFKSMARRDLKRRRVNIHLSHKQQLLADMQQMLADQRARLERERERRRQAELARRRAELARKAKELKAKADAEITAHEKAIKIAMHDRSVAVLLRGYVALAPGIDALEDAADSVHQAHRAAGQHAVGILKSMRGRIGR